MGDFAVGDYPTHGLVGLLTWWAWQEPWNIHCWMTALLRSDHSRVFVAYFPYRLVAVFSSPAFSAKSHPAATTTVTTFLPSGRGESGPDFAASVPSTVIQEFTLGSITPSDSL
jgi:hypothetical protein